MLAPVCAWVALAGFSNITPAVLLGVAVLLWVAGFDIIYACQDVAVDAAQGLYSVPAQFGVPRALRLASVCHLGTVLALAALPIAFPQLGWVYYAGLAAVAALLLYEHCLVRPDDLTRVNVAFFHVNAVISVGLLVIAAIDLWMRG
jgi:4-hydroxybenzoate polyprenyltransferase